MVNNTTQNALKLTIFISKCQKNYHRPQHWRRQGAAPPPQWPGKKIYVKIEGLLEPVVLNLSFRVPSNALFTSERRYYCYTYTQNIKNNLKLSALFYEISKKKS